MQRILDVVASIEPLNSTAQLQASERQRQLTKPAGSLGRLEAVAIQIAGITGHPVPTAARKVVVVMAGDHGVTAQGVSAYPAAVTPQMVLNFAREGAAINALARQVGARVVVVDIGVAEDVTHPQVLNRKVARGTDDMSLGPAMTNEMAIAAMAVGLEIAEEEAARGVDLLATGEMGIGNTTAASAITAALTGTAVPLVTGRGTGISDEQLAHKIRIIERALERNQPDPSDPLDVLAKVGGLEIAGLAGVILGAAAHHVPVVVDGFISGAAALIAVRLCPLARDYLIAGHVSAERGHRLILEELGLAPLLDLDLRLGEGTGAALAMGLIDAALRAHREMATFDEAGVSQRQVDAL